MSQYTVPNVFHFVWFGSSISPCEATLKAWREFHPEATINLWLSTDATFNQESSFISELKKINAAFQTGMVTPLQSATSLSLTNEKRLDEIRKIGEQYKITVRYIEEETGLDARDLTIEELCLNNRDLIIQEVKNKRYWSDSDIARFAILNKEPVFYFDIGIIPKQSLRNKVFCSSGFSLIFDTQAYILRMKVFVFVTNYFVLLTPLTLFLHRYLPLFTLSLPP